MIYPFSSVFGGAVPGKYSQPVILFVFSIHPLADLNVKLITAKLTKYNLSLSLNFNLRLMEANYKFQFGMQRHNYANHITSSAYFR